MICTEFKHMWIAYLRIKCFLVCMHHGCIQNIFILLVLNSHHFARMLNVCICSRVAECDSCVCMYICYYCPAYVLDVFQFNMLTCVSLIWKLFCFHDVTVSMKLVFSCSQFLPHAYFKMSYGLYSRFIFSCISLNIILYFIKR